MKTEKKYFVVATRVGGDALKSDSFVSLCQKGSPNFALLHWGDLWESYYDKSVKPVSREQADAMVAFAEAKKEAWGIDNIRVYTEQQLLARFYRRMHVFERWTSSREPVNRFGKLAIVSNRESFYGSEADCGQINKGLRIRFEICDNASKEEKRHLMGMNTDLYIAVEQHLTSDYYGVNRLEWRYIVR